MGTASRCHLLKNYIHVYIFLRLPVLVAEKETTVFIPLTPWALTNFKFLDLESGRLLEVGAYSGLGAY